MKKKISVILPTYNEKENIEELISQIVHYVKGIHEIIVVDDNSPDSTWQIVEGIIKKNKKIRLIRRTDEKGLASAIARGIAESKGNIVIWLDSDLSMPPSVIPKLISNIPEYDVVIGSRYAEGGKDNRSFIRVVTSRMINLYTNFLLSFKVKDFDTGFVAAKKEVFNHVSIMKHGYGQYCIRFLYDCIRKGYRIKEVGFAFTDRQKGVSKSGSTLSQLLKHGWDYGTEVLKIRMGR